MIEKNLNTILQSAYFWLPLLFQSSGVWSLLTSSIRHYFNALFIIFKKIGLDFLSFCFCFF